MEQDKIDEAVYTYYKLKNSYEIENDIIKKEIIKSDKSWKEKRKEYKKYKPKCINCKKTGGTIFLEEYEKKDGIDSRVLMAHCGNKENPCPLDIKIYLGRISSYKDVIIENKEVIKECKNNIIKHKNDTIFGYIEKEKAIEEFTSLKEELEMNIDYNEYILTITDETEREKIIESLQKDIIKDIQAIKNLMCEYDTSKNVKYIEDVITLYKNELYVKIEQMNKLKYPIRYVEKNKINKNDKDDKNDVMYIYNLIQKKKDLYDIGGKRSIEKMVVNVLNIDSTKKKKKKGEKGEKKGKILKKLNMKIKLVQDNE